MIIAMLLIAGTLLIKAIMALLDVLPSLPFEVINILTQFFQILFNGVSLASIFIDMNMVKMLIPVVIAIINLDRLYKLIMFILKKIPFINIH